MKNLFIALIEHKEFKKSRPWTVVWQRYDSAVISTPHYAETIEILVCKDISGSAYIDGVKYDMSGQKVFYIAPMTVHSFEYQHSEGMVAVIKIHIEMMRKFLDVDSLFAQYGATVADPSALQTDYSVFAQSAEKMESGDVSEALIGVLSIIRTLATGEKKRSSAPAPAGHDVAINDIIAWTEQNLRRKIPLDEVAGHFGYTKNYFCNMFKKSTGTTYLRYLNNLRISSACAMLRRGEPVKNVCAEFGFETDSHFINLFKKTVGVTPKQYQKSFKLGADL